MRFVLLVFALLLISACGNNKKVVTKDDSADYTSARSLPPLKKPSRVVVTRPADPVQAEPIQAEPVQAEPVQVEPVQADPMQADTIEPAASLEAENQAPAAAIAARVIKPTDDVSRMQIDADFDSAWAYLSDNLKRSDLTVYSRNEAAGRVSIGCADIESAAVVEKRGGWSFISRKKIEQLEYCALQAISTKGATVVTVLNRAGQEVSSEYAARVFQRILNN